MCGQELLAGQRHLGQRNSRTMSCSCYNQHRMDEQVVTSDLDPDDPMKDFGSTRVL
jgi:hypothetical protein